MRYAVAVFLVRVALLAQTAPPSCPADLPVDDIIAEIHKQQSKKKHRNTNPLPQGICIGASCVGRPGTPPTIPEPPPTRPAPRTETSGGQNTTSSSDNSSKGPKSAQEKCDERMALALEAANDIDVGDYYFEGKKNYQAAYQRYRDALDAKPGDAAIHVRLGRVLEKLNQVPQAIEQYQTAEKLTGPQKWSDEAGSALQRLEHP